jgi:hypothetical protein
MVLAADTEKCAAFFRSMKESQRRTFSARALQWAGVARGFIAGGQRQFLAMDRELARDVQNYENSKSGKAAFPQPINVNCYPVAQMALLASAGFPELKKSGVLGVPAPDLAVQILKDRRPAWIDKWCSLILDAAATSHWLALHQLERLGVCRLERKANYWQSMLCTLSNTPDLYEKILLNDQSIVAEIWPMLDDPTVRNLLSEPETFAAEIFRKRWRTGRNIFAPSQTATRRGSEIWRAVLVRAATEGTLARDRVVEFSFLALTEAAEKTVKSSGYTAVSSADFAIKLNQELVQDGTAPFLSRYASLLGANHRDVSTYCSKVLIAMPESSSALEEICSCVQPVFLNKNKEPAEAALQLLERLSREDSSARADYGPALLAALNHPSKEVIKKAIGLIESTSLLADNSLRQEYLARIDVLTGMERSAAAKLAAQYQSKLCTAADTKSGVSDRPSTEELYKRAAALDPKLKELASVREALEAVQNHKWLDQPVKLNTLINPRLNPDAVISPIANVHDLIYAAAKAMSGRPTAMELELVLDGISRLFSERPEDFQEKTAVLREKASKYLSDAGIFSQARSLEYLILVWLDGPIHDNNPRISMDASLFYTRRCLAIAKRVKANHAAPLLAMPTHAGGWIDPRTLVDRLGRYIWLKVEPDEVDFIQALLRIAPDRRAEALSSAESIKGEVGKALRYALQGGQISINQMPEYWVAAFRALDPEGNCPELQELLPKLGPDGALAAVYGFDPEPISLLASDRYASWSSGLPNFLPVQSADPDFLGWQSRSRFDQKQLSSTYSSTLYPTILLHDNANSFTSGINTYNWLHNRESLLAMHAKRVLCNINSIGSYWLGEFEFLFDPDVSLARNGRYFICAAMSSKNNDLSRLAVDVLISAVGDIRIGARDYGAAMAAFLPSKIITTVRWIRGLRDASKVSPLHAQFVWQAVSALIRNAASQENASHIPFLELLIELQIAHGFGIDESTRRCLADIASSGTGKTTKLAKTLTSSIGKENDQEEAARQDLELRLGRVERWQNWARLAQSKAAATVQ